MFQSWNGQDHLRYWVIGNVQHRQRDDHAAARSGHYRRLRCFRKVFYAYEGNIHCTGATIKWLVEQLGILASPKDAEALATSIPDNDGVYFVPAFAGLGAPWWKSDAKAMIWGLTLGSSKVHVVRAALESIALSGEGPHRL